MLFGDSREAVQKQAFSRKSARENITRNRVFVVRKSPKLQENVNIIKSFKSLTASVRDLFYI